MKKYNLFKILGLSFLGLVLLSWLIPASTYSNGTFAQGPLNPIGLIDLFRLPINAIGNYYQYGLFILVLGGFYSIVNATGVYSKFVDMTVKVAKKEKVLFLVATVSGFALLAAISGVNYVIFVLVPFFLAVLVLAGYNKLSALAATVGAILVGNFASIYGFNVSGYINYFLKVDINALLWAKVILFAVSVAALVYFIMINEAIFNLKEKEAKKGKKATKEKVEELNLSLYKKVKANDRKLMPLLVIVGLTMFILFVSTYNWRYGLNVFFFEEMYQSMLSFKVFGFALFDALIGNVYPFGYWGQLEVVVVLLFASALIAWIYSIRFDDAIEKFIDGVKEMVVPAFYVTMSSFVLAYISGAAGSDMFNTIEYVLLTLTKELNVFTTAIMSLIGSLFYNDFSYFTSVVAPNITAAYTDAATHPLAGLVLQTFHGLMMLLLPTSLFLVAGLSIMKVSFVDWIKYVWQYALQLLALASFVILLVVLF